MSRYHFTYRTLGKPHEVRQGCFDAPGSYVHPSYKMVLREAAVSIAVGILIGENMTLHLADRMGFVQSLRKEIIIENIWHGETYQDLLT